MRSAILLCSVVIATAFYTDVDENLDIDSIMADPAKLQPYLDCFLDKKPCTNTAIKFKGNLKK